MGTADSKQIPLDPFFGTSVFCIYLVVVNKELRCRKIHTCNTNTSRQLQLWETWAMSSRRKANKLRLKWPLKRLWTIAETWPTLITICKHKGRLGENFNFFIIFLAISVEFYFSAKIVLLRHCIGTKMQSTFVQNSCVSFFLYFQFGTLTTKC